LTYHATKIGVGVKTRKVLLLGTGEARGRQIHLGFEIVVEVLVVAHRIVLLGGVHDLKKC